MLHTTLAIHYGSEYASTGVRRLYQNISSRRRKSGSSVDDAEEIHCEFTLTLETEPPPTNLHHNDLLSDEGIETDSPEDLRSETDSESGLQSMSRAPHDPENVFPQLFKDDDDLDLNFVKKKIEGRRLVDVLTWIDSDHYNLLEKAIVYNNRSLVNILLENDTTENTFGFGQSSPSFEDTIQHFRGSIHLAAFLGCVDIVQEFLDHNSSLCILRGPVHIQPVSGPPHDLFRIIGYSEASRNPRLNFQMKWLKNHPNERPVHYAICGGYPLIMKMLLAYDTVSDSPDEEEDTEEKLQYMTSATTEKDAHFANLVRQAASCASYSCLSALLHQTRDIMYMRDQRGWLYIASGIPHGMQFIKFLLEQGFAVKLLNNIDGRNNVNALHIFYSSLSKADGAISKYTELFDVTEFMLDLGVEVNMETTSFRSHEVSDTPLHILLDNVNLVVSSVIQDDNLPKDARLIDDIQQVYDESIRDTLCILIESGFDLQKHCNSLLKRLFMNRNFLKRFEKSKQEPKLVQCNYGLRNMFNIAKLLLGSGGIQLSPARREITPSLSLIDALRDGSGVQCVFGDRRATQMFISCLKVLYENGDNPNVYPFSSKDDSYLAIPLVHLCDIYVEHLGHVRDLKIIKPTMVNAIDAIIAICDAGSHFTCFMSTRNNYFKHGAFDNFRKLFHVIHRQLSDSDQSLNKFRLQAITQISTVLIQRGADPFLQEYIFRKSHLPMTNTQVEMSMLGQVLLLGLHCSANSPMFPYGPELVSSDEFKKCLELFQHLTEHEIYYKSLEHVLSMARDTEIFGEEAENTEYCQDLVILAQSVRSLKHLTRMVIRSHVKPNIRSGYRFLPLPAELMEFIIN